MPGIRVKPWNRVDGPIYSLATTAKGKGNLKPHESYLPFVQDFVKSGNWSDVGDIRNAGLFKVTPGQRLPGFSQEMEPGYYTLDDFKRIAAEKEMPQEIQDVWFQKLQRGFAHGGAVHISDNPDVQMGEVMNPLFMDEGGAAFGQYTTGNLIITAMDISICFADFPTEAIGVTTRDYRQLGIGYANLGALLMATGLPYDSEGGRALGPERRYLLGVVGLVGGGHASPSRVQCKWAKAPTSVTETAGRLLKSTCA